MKDISNADVERAVAGDSATVDEIVRSLERPVFHLALRMLMHHDDAEEAAQEALIRIVTRLATFRGDGRFSTWAWSVATRSVLDFHRARSRVPQLAFEDFEADLERDLDSVAPERAEDAVYLAQVKIGCARAMLQCLDANHRIVYVLGEILGIDQREAAAALALSHAAFRKRLGRARGQLVATLRRACGVVNDDAMCRCHRRLAPARRLRRLDERDSAVIDVAALQTQVRKLDELHQAAAYFRADPQESVAERILPEVYRALGLGAA